MAAGDRMTWCWMCETTHCEPVASWPNEIESEPCPEFQKAIDLLSRLAFEEPIYDGRDGCIESTDEPYTDDWGGA